MSKSMAKNSLYNVLYRTLNIIFPFITSIYVARVLMADSIGKVAAAQNIVQYFTLLASMGIPTYGVKLVAQFKTKSKESSKAFSELFIINFWLSIVCIIGYYSFILICPYFDGKEMLYFITGLNIVFNVINVDWFYQGIQEYGYIAVRSLLVKFVALISLFLFVKTKNDYLIYALVMSGALVGNYTFNIIRIKKYIRFEWHGLEYKEHLNHILTLFIATIAAEVYVLADTTMLDVMCDSTTVGYYTISMRIIKIIRTLVVAVSAVFLPQLSYYYYNGNMESFKKLTNKGLHILIAISFPVALGLMLVTDDAILTLFKSPFAGAIFTTRVLAISIITIALSNFIGLQILVTMGKEKITTISTVCGAVINITLNLILIPLYKHNGAAVASVITEGSVTIIQLVLSRKYLQYHFHIRTVLFPLLAMGLVVFGVHQLPIMMLARLIIECTLGIITYVVVGIMVKEEFITEIVSFFKKRVNSIGES